MDILRQELNEIYSRQHLESEVLSEDERLKAIKAVGALAEVQNVCAVITDLQRDCSLLFPQSLGVRLGLMPTALPSLNFIQVKSLPSLMAPSHSASVRAMWR